MVVRSYEQLHTMLLKEQQRLKAAIAQHPVMERTPAGYGNHAADDATDVFDQAANVSLLQSLWRNLEEVEAALARFEQGTYGLCLRCGEKIEWARLEAHPQAALCMRCQRRQESR
ncbi:MAG: TraR/DksA C4-type zinc finger protein [Anaerolineae bacterium]|nr:TraR/DksA C4-type zinc finger protein [Anaerolineae bacterium]